ncbi:DNA alkylation repair protein [Candidatus Curtissbacteria bacterium RIFCSPHIGHO2_12_41_11]|uniref:DNA alkylation repair protein n=3 Tax=Candidatus Curtissiibacteriota TaxID=1752717 RepID=A0A1F5HV20_9BACT|nr:MAG: hypothetical protein UU56_C0002G0041 [Candidatus Curtissbacteria bacterium GW2011_GWA2_41_24]OGD89495.1 MAG: DNA alkylation repair protein [Candidatus Curtissbacteria bacterium RIFCSPHIGHO2_02_39_8]OGD99100.1 MAG: DNA alkylation repair protein [Candidatus Curtissbacteria bacterium RIFCSPHIGHO2_12_41_11]OGE07835.1 MAG: DNA alkylation repair protein [Candidatus Curtissbacteria bacterium RIFCSPLOWO2_02_41_11]
MQYAEVLRKLKSQTNPKNVQGMVKFGINSKNTLGISIPILRKLAKEIGTNHTIAQQLWDSGIHEARILASMVDDPKQVSEKQMDLWTSDFDSWDVCDQVCMNFFDKTPHAFQKAKEWTRRDNEFEKRAGFALMACLAWHDKNSSNESFSHFFSLIKQAATDERNFVKKAVNWALRQIGKRNRNLNKMAIGTAQEIIKIDSKTAKWIATDALRELTSDAILKRLT